MLHTDDAISGNRQCISNKMNHFKKEMLDRAGYVQRSSTFNCPLCYKVGRTKWRNSVSPMAT